MFGNTSDSSDSTTSGGAELNSGITNVDSKARSEVGVHDELHQHQQQDTGKLIISAQSCHGCRTVIDIRDDIIGYSVFYNNQVFQ